MNQVSKTSLKLKSQQKTLVHMLSYVSNAALISSV